MGLPSTRTTLDTSHFSEWAMRAKAQVRFASCTSWVTKTAAHGVLAPSLLNDRFRLTPLSPKAVVIAAYPGRSTTFVLM